jgi:hypothetical protein
MSGLKLEEGVGSALCGTLGRYGPLKARDLGLQLRNTLSQLIHRKSRQFLADLMNSRLLSDVLFPDHSA